MAWMLTETVAQLPIRFAEQSKTFEQYRRVEVNDRQAHHLVIEMFDKGALNLLDVPKCLKEWRVPRYPKFSNEKTAWRLLLAGESDITIAAECASGREAIAAVDTHRPDLLFLDIQMPQVNGFDVLRALPAQHLPAVIFTTAYDQHALKAFEVHALDYLLKPFKVARFKAALQRAREYLQKRRGGDTDTRILALLKRLQTARNHTTRFVIKSASRVVMVKTSDIDWIESAANYALLHVGDKTHLLRETMRSLEEQLSQAQFVRVSRSAIVNIDRIKELQPMMKGEYVVILNNGKQLTMTRGIRDLQQALEPA